ncbi:hypothetical protein DUNSADRAFT_10338 [Dunaliella salina]|uniref:Uncharacterized protein n=1 Tax=Dunaliella salina TaxID=3046 RepID=A0ABQ7H4W5_DUNSA|nr:hypothetical protein DUNSADRAFT_10338 [Dunaliella salina]|eukprot:KAF5841902.1 hypothetical protein DUNSADRAFT_10338 [Dunaliella salina]
MSTADRHGCCRQAFGLDAVGRHLIGCYRQAGMSTADRHGCCRQAGRHGCYRQAWDWML